MLCGVDHHGGFQARLQPAQVPFGGGFGKLVETVGPGLEAAQINLALGDLRVQGRQSARGHDVRTGGDRKLGQVGTVVPGILVDEGAAHFRITSKAS